MTAIPPCWKQTGLGRVLALDAGANIGESGPFIAVHVPLPGWEYRPGRHYLDAPDDSTEVADVALAAFSALTVQDGDDQALIVPVVGEPGSGKSHLVRWIYHRLLQERRLGETRFLPAYLPRQQASFEGMVDAIEEAVEAEGDDDARQVVALLRARVVTLKSRGVTELAKVVSTEMWARLNRIVETSDDRDAVLASSLRDVVVEAGGVADYYASPESPTGRRARRLLGKTSDGEDGDAHDPGFSPDDLRHLATIPGVSNAFAVAIREIARRDTGDLEHACRLLNRVLEESIAAQLQADGQQRPVTMAEALRQLRRALRKSDTELVLLVEDLVSLEGLGRTLLDALIEPPDKATCRIRALIASTGNYWGGLIDEVGTLGDRLIAPTYALALPDLDAGQSRELTLAVAASYLNATRVGADHLQRLYDEVPESERDGWSPPTACEGCAYREACHAAFGKVELSNGRAVGLFPFSAEALMRTYPPAARDRNVPEDIFNPRVLVRHVLLPIVKYAGASLKKGAFPVPELTTVFSSSAARAVLRADLQAAQYTDDDADADRAALVLELWGEANGTETQLPAGIATAFSLPEPVPSVKWTPGKVAPESGRKRKGKDPAPEQVDSMSESLRQWFETGEIGMRDANTVRRLVFDWALASVPWTEFAGESPSSTSPIRGELGLRSHEHSIVIEGAETDQPEDATVLASLKRNDATYLFLNALVTPRSATADSMMSGADLVNIAEGLRPLSETLEALCEARGFSRDAPISPEEPAVIALAATSAILGLMPHSALEAQSIGKSLLRPESEGEPPESSRLGEVAQVARQGVRSATRLDLFEEDALANRESARLWLLRRLALRQSVFPTSTQEIRLIDAARLIAVSQQLCTVSIDPSNVLAPQSFADGRRSFTKLLEKLFGSPIDAAVTSIAGTWRSVRGKHDHFAIPDFAPISWFDGLQQTRAEVLKALLKLREIQQEATGAAAERLTHEVANGQIDGRASLGAFFAKGEEQEARTLSLIEFGLQMGELDKTTGRPAGQRLDELARLGALGGDTSDLGEAIRTFAEDAETVLEVSLARLETGLTNANPVIAKFDQEFGELINDLEGLLGAPPKTDGKK